MTTTSSAAQVLRRGPPCLRPKDFFGRRGFLVAAAALRSHGAAPAVAGGAGLSGAGLPGWPLVAEGNDQDCCDYAALSSMFMVRSTFHTMVIKDHSCDSCDKQEWVINIEPWCTAPVYVVFSWKEEFYKL